METTLVLCRLCGQGIDIRLNSPIFNNVQYHNLPDIIKSRIGIQVLEDDDLPQSICIDCLETLISFDVFSKRCSDQQSNLRQLLHKVYSQSSFTFTHLPLPLSQGVDIINQGQQSIVGSEDTRLGIDIAAVNEPQRTRSISTITLRPQSKHLTTEEIKLDPRININITNANPNHVQSYTSTGCCIGYLTESKCPIEITAINNTPTTSIKAAVTSTPIFQPRPRVKVNEARGQGNIQIEPIVHVTSSSKERVEVSVNAEESEIDKDEFITGRNIPDVCAYCMEVIPKTSCLQIHIRSRHPGQPMIFKCPKCEKSFQTKSGLDRHKDTHSDHPMFCCDLCGKRFKSQPSFCNHKKNHDPTSYRFRCNFENCEKVYNSKSTLREHSRVHSGESPYQCDECDQTFRTRSQLNSHKWMHADIRNYPCPHCPRRFRHNSHVKAHIRRHKGEKPLECGLENCEKRFVSKYDLLRHRRTHTGERPFQCHICPKTLIDSGSFRKHMRTHNDNVYLTGFGDHNTAIPGENLETVESIDVETTATTAYTVLQQDQIQHSESENQESEEL